MTRWKASATHLVLSLLVLAAIAAFVAWRWYPPALFHMAKADKLLLTLAGVDLVLGPLLTLIVYKQGKKSLKFDLTVIVLLQLGALGYGLHTLWHSRPVYLVGVVDRFELVFANEIDPADLDRAKDPFRTLPSLGARVVGAELPTDPAERERILFSALERGKDVHLLPEYYVDYSRVSAGLLRRSMPATLLAERLAPDGRDRLRQAIADTGVDPGRLAALPIASQRESATMLVDTTDGRVVKPVDVDPWAAFSAPISDVGGHGAPQK